MPACSQPRTLGEIAEYAGLSLKGDPACLITGINTLEKAGPGDLSFLTNPLYQKHLPATKASAVVLPAEAAELCNTNALISEQPRLAYTKIATWFFQPKERSLKGIDPTATIGQGVEIDPSAYVGPYCVVGDSVVIGPNACLMNHVSIADRCRIGEGSVLYPKTVLYTDVHIGAHSLVHSGTTLGSDGFGFEPDEKGHWHKVPQIGGVRIGSHVEIGANCTIDRGAVEDTILEDGVILDNLIQIAHNVQIGAHSAIAGCTGISGSTKIGKHCLIGGGSCIKGHISIADGVMISGMSMVTRSIRKPGTYSSGIPVKEKALWLKNANRFHQLDDMARRLKAVEKKVGSS